MTMTWIDWLIVTIVVFSVPQGLRKGGPAAAGSVLGVAVAYLVASFGYASFAGAFGFIPLSPAWQATIAFLVVFLVASSILTIVASALLGSLTPSRSSRLAGAAIGAARGVVLSAGLLAIAMASPYGGPVASDVTRSVMAGPIAGGDIAVIEWLNAQLPPSVRIFGGSGARF